jgi:hypothetical protein
VRKGEAGNQPRAAPLQDVEMVEGTGVDANEHLVRTGFGDRDVSALQHVGAAVGSMEYDLHARDLRWQ